VTSPSPFEPLACAYRAALARDVDALKLNTRRSSTMKIKTKVRGGYTLDPRDDGDPPPPPPPRGCG
jgi:hypothetical protein